jgi:hypothetical protein
MRVIALAVCAVALLPAAAASRPVDSGRASADCSRTSVGYPPLMDMASGTYRGFSGGLYLGGSNLPPRFYSEQGLEASREVQPIEGKIVLLSIGMSNTTQEYQGFKRLADVDPARNPAVLVVDGAQGGQDAERIRRPDAPYWQVVDQRLAAAGASRIHVQAAWLKQAIAGENRPFPADAAGLQGALRDIVGIMRDRYPNLRLIYLSSRIYAGYATTQLNPEPYAYQSGYAVKWLIEERIRGRWDGGPWLGWGPYLWTDGLAGRSDGLQWTCADVQQDGTHPSTSGVNKVAKLLLAFFKRDPTASMWFVRDEDAAP